MVALFKVFLLSLHCSLFNLPASSFPGAAMAEFQCLFGNVSQKRSVWAARWKGMPLNIRLIDQLINLRVARYKICNMQPCPVSTDFRAKQCSIFNNKPYRDRFYEWLPFIDPAEPCSLTCQAKGLNFVAKLAASVKDGTRCRPGTLEMCVAGKCLV